MTSRRRVLLGALALPFLRPGDATRAQSAADRVPTDPRVALALQAMALWNPEPVLFVNTGYDTDNGAMIWDAVPDGSGGLFPFGHVLHVPGSPDLTSSTGYRDLIRTYRTAFPDLTVTVDDVVSQADTVVLRWAMEGTHTGPFGGIDPTGNTIRVTGATFFRVADGQIQETWIMPNGLGLLDQLGAVPEA